MILIKIWVKAHFIEGIGLFSLDEELTLELVAELGGDPDRVIIVADQGRDVDGVAVAVHLGGDHGSNPAAGADLHIIIAGEAVGHQDDFLGVAVIVHLGHVGRNEVLGMVATMMAMFNINLIC